MHQLRLEVNCSTSRLGAFSSRFSGDSSPRLASGFFLNYQFDKYPRTVADINGDGNADIVGFGQSGVLTALSNGDGTFREVELVLNDFAFGAGGWSSFDKYPRTVADINGDDRADIVGFGQSGVLTALSDADTLNFDLVGSLELESTFSQTITSSVTDVLLNGSLLNGNSADGLEIIRDEFGAPVQVRYTANAEAERLWIVKEKENFTTQSANQMQHDVITGFTPGTDKIAIAHREIDEIGDLDISYSGGNADIHFGDRHFAKFFSIEPNSLDASDFVFSTKGTVFDNSIPSV